MPNVRREWECSCVWRHRSLWGLWLLLEDEVDHDLKEDEEHNDDVVALLEERATLRPACRTTPQHTDAPADTRELWVNAQKVGHQSSGSWCERDKQRSHLFMSSCVFFIDSMALWSSLRSAPFFLSRLLCLLLCPATMCVRRGFRTLRQIKFNYKHFPYRKRLSKCIHFKSQLTFHFNLQLSSYSSTLKCTLKC